MPLIGTVAGILFVPFAMFTEPCREPTAAGVNVMLIVHEPLTAKGDDDAQLSVSAKSPIALTATIFIGLWLVFVTVSACAELVVPTFWLPNVSETGLTVITGGGTVTGTIVWTLWPFRVYVAVIVVLPALPPVTIPFASTVATAVFADEYVTYVDSVTSSTLPSEKVARSFNGNCSPSALNVRLGICGEIAIGMSARSTSIRMVAEWTN